MSLELNTLRSTVKPSEAQTPLKKPLIIRVISDIAVKSAYNFFTEKLESGG